MAAEVRPALKFGGCNRGAAEANAAENARRMCCGGVQVPMASRTAEDHAKWWWLPNISQHKLAVCHGAVTLYLETPLPDRRKMDN